MKIFNSLKNKDSLPYINYPEKKDGNILERIAYFQKREDIEPLIDIWTKEVISQDTLSLPHPEKNNVLTTAIESQCIGVNNYILFIDKSNTHSWIMAQCAHFIDLIVTEKAIYKVSRYNNQTILNNLIHFSPKNKTYKKKRLSLLVQNHRPYHFFYDQLKFIVGLQQHIKKPIKYNDYFIPKNHKNKDIRNSIYILPTIGGNNFFPAAKNPTVKLFNEKMEKFVLDNGDDSSVQVGNDTFLLWYGITGQKRSWLQQVDAIEHIVKKLKNNFKKVIVYIDGLTSPEEAATHSEDDIKVVDQISKKLNGLCEYHSMVDWTYKQKIAVGRCIDIFIANSGTGSLVPMRFCHRPGVLHSNTKFSSLSPPEGINVKRANKKFIIDVDTEFNGRNDFVSYHIPWQHIYNLMIDVYNKEKKTNFEKVIVQDVKQLDEEWLAIHKNALAQKKALIDFKINLKPHFIEADILRETADAFERVGDIDLATVLMEKALALRPHGKVIAKKLADLYKKQIDL